MSKVALNYWPSLVLLLVLLAGLVTCLNRLDYLVVEEVRTLISILFGFVTSCLLLSFIWLIQRRPSQNRIGSNVPNMHPRARSSSSDSDYMTINTIANGMLDVPPAYEDALINSKPVQRHEKTISQIGLMHIDCDCSDPDRYTNHQRGGSSSKLECDQCLKQTLHRHARSDLKRQRKTSASNSSAIWGQSEHQRARKMSLAQLDVAQLAALSGSPPKYRDLHLYGYLEHHSVDKSTIDMT